MTMAYAKGPMMALYNDLVTLHGDLIKYGSDMEDAGGVLKVAWEGNVAHASFKQVYDAWHSEYGDTLTSLNNVAAAVENSLHRALGTDGKIGDGFGA
ncbi:MULTISPECIES: hypothetical protein [Nocardia]|uniref:hypothetical protein n=1 Tax=Nocardia TaxID=1817 RepID=UPI000A4BE914|nr:hypothetical protein [Nocardia pseudovaccinii]